MSVAPYERGLVRTSERTYTFLQPDGGWGWSNAGLIVGDDEAVLVDTFFDLANTRELLESIGRTVDRPRATVSSSRGSSRTSTRTQCANGWTRWCLASGT